MKIEEILNKVRNANVENKKERNARKEKQERLIQFTARYRTLRDFGPQLPDLRSGTLIKSKEELLEFLENCDEPEDNHVPFYDENGRPLHFVKPKKDEGNGNN